LAERGVAVSYETVRRWVNHFGPMIAADLRKRRLKPHTTWHLDEVYLKIDGRMVYLWRAVDAEGEVLGVLVQSKRNKHAALKLMRKLLRKYALMPSVDVDGAIGGDAPLLPPGLRARAVRDRLDERLFCRKSRDAGNERTCDEGLGAESKDNAISGLRLCWARSVNHAVVVDRVGRRNFDGAKCRGIRSWLARYDRSQRIVGKDWVNIETATEAEGLASRQVRNLGQVNNRWRLRQVIGHV
jgi:hypothetical protein